MSELYVRCTDCQRSDDLPWLPLVLAQSCGECAQNAVEAHLDVFPGHRCEVVGEPERSSVVQLRKRQG